MGEDYLTERVREIHLGFWFNDWTGSELKFWAVPKRRCRIIPKQLWFLLINLLWEVRVEASEESSNAKDA